MPTLATVLLLPRRPPLNYIGVWEVYTNLQLMPGWTVNVLPSALLYYCSNILDTLLYYLIPPDV